MLPPVSKIKRKVLVGVGTRPEAIKLLPLVQALAASDRMEPFVVATGQHPSIVEEIFAAGGVSVDVNLAVGRAGITLNELFSTVITRFQEMFFERFGVDGGGGPARDHDVFPAVSVVHGDTSSAAAVAVASFHLQIPVAHVEAGLRTSDIRSPFPEELNRQIISRIAAFHLAPTWHNLQNLVRENVPVERSFFTGNTAIDALMWAARQRRPYDVPELEFLDDDETTPIVVITAHRRENWGAGLERIGEAVRLLARAHPDTRFILPVHPNPAVARTLRAKLDDESNVLICEPLKYGPFARLLGRATIVLTDSGGVQEEAPSLGTPVLVMRETTERSEGVDAGTLRLVGTDIDRIVSNATELLRSREARERMTGVHNPYGDGRAAQRIVQAFEHVAWGKPPPEPYGSGFNRLAVLRAGGFDEDPSLTATESIQETIIAETEVPTSQELVESVLES